MDVDGSGRDAVLIGPHGEQQLVAGDHGGAVVHEAAEQVQLLGAKADDGFALSRVSPLEIDFDILKGDDARRRPSAGL